MSQEECLVESAEDIVHMIMTQHWDLAACPCWVCEAGRAAGLYPTSHFLDWRKHGYEPVNVDDQWVEYRVHHKSLEAS